MDNHLLILITEIALGISLSACAGLRAFLPLLVISILSRTGHLHLGDTFAWIDSTPALIIFGTATVVEIIGDKFPAVDHMLDMAGMFIKPLAGAILFSAAVVKFEPLTAIVLGIITGGSLSELIHLKKASLRAASTGLTLGIANPLISTIEDIGSLAAIIISVLAPIMAAVMIMGTLFITFRILKSLIARRASVKIEPQEQ